MSEVVLDASALLALVKGETGADRVESVLHQAVICSVNLAEVVAVLADRQMPEKTIRRILDKFDLRVVAFDEELAYVTDALRPASRAAGLSLGDRACLALAHRLGRPAVTTDRAWAGVDLGIAIHFVR